MSYPHARLILHWRGFGKNSQLVGETLHHALNVLAQEVPAWMRAQVTAEWFLRSSQRFSDYRLPKRKPDWQQLAETIGRDGVHLLTPIHGAAAPAPLRELLREVLNDLFIKHGRPPIA